MKVRDPAVNEELVARWMVIPLPTGVPFAHVRFTPIGAVGFTAAVSAVGVPTDVAAWTEADHCEYAHVDSDRTR